MSDPRRGHPLLSPASSARPRRRVSARGSTPLPGAAVKDPSDRAAYPHVDGIADWRAQQSVRLLWDRVFDFEQRLQAAETDAGELATRVDQMNTAIITADRKADEALATVQLTKGQRQEGEGPGEPTIPNYLAAVQQTLATFNPVVAAADEEAAKAQLTRAAAWNIYNGNPPRQADPAIGLCQKLTGNNVNGLSVDLVVQQSNGDFADIASSRDNGDGTVTILATWSAHAGDGTLIPRWVQPTAALASAPGPMGPAA